MKKQTIGIIIASILVVFLLFLGITFLYEKEENIEFYGRVLEASNTYALVEPLNDDKLAQSYSIIEVDVTGLKAGDVIKVVCDKEFEEKFPPVARVKNYEIVIDSTTSTTELTSTSTSSEVSKITTTSKKITTNTTSKITTSRTLKKTTTTKMYTTTKNQSVISTEDGVISVLEANLLAVETNKENKSFLETAKEYFITAVDFIFYDKDINGVYFDDLTNKAKLTVISLTLKLDDLVNKYFPNYKDNISSKYQDIKSKLVGLYLDKTNEFCANNDSVCEQAKSDFQLLKNSLNITWDVIKNLAGAGVSKLKEWYEIYSGK